MSLSRAALVLTLLAAGPLPVPAQRPASGRAFTPVDWYRLTTVGSPAVSPDGRRVAFTVTTVREKENRRHAEIWVAPMSGGAPVRYTAPGAESSNPRFSPDGSLLLFTSKRAGGAGTTWAIRLNEPGEAYEAVNYPEGSTPRDGRFAVWSDSVTPLDPDSAKKTEDPFETMGPMARPPFGAITRPTDPKRFDGRHVVERAYKSNSRGYVPGLRARREWRPAQIWMQPFDGTAKRQLTSTAYSHRSAVVSPDGRWIAFAADTALRSDSAVTAYNDSLARLPFDRVRDTLPENDIDLWVMPIGGGTPRRVARLPGNERDIAWTSDSRRLSFISSLRRTTSDRLWLVDAAGGTPRNLLGTWQYEPGGYTWLANGDIAMSAAVGGRTALFRVSPSSGAIREVLGGRRRLSGFAYDRARTQVAFVATSLTRPTELYVADIDGRNERRLTSFNDSVNARIAWSDAERFTYRSVGNVEIEGWLMKPFGYRAGSTYPLVLYIHGGPHSAYGEGWFDEFQNLAGAGMFVLFTNPRGSTGYGADFTYSTRGRWGAEDYEDLMKAVDLVAKRPDVDSTRMGVSGGSYGGFMTAWITTRTNRFRAAQADRMIARWGSWYGSSDAQGLTDFEFFGKPWDNPAMYDTLSPIRYVDRVRTPTLIVQSEDDFRTPMGEAEQWFNALRTRGVPVELIRYPRSTHELSRSGEPWLLVDRLGRLRQWFGYWLLDRTVAADSTPAGDVR